ncbi:MAG: glycosyltransferase [Oceanicoccus sp.]
MEKPLVSVYIPTHKRPKLLKRAISSVVNQSYSNIEIIVSSDGECSDTKKVVDRFGAIHKNIRFISSKSNQGACATRNSAINVASGVYITGLDDDDYFSNTRIEEFINSLSESRQILFSNYMVIDDYGVSTTEFVEHVKIDELLKYNAIGNQIFCPTKYIREAGGFDINLPAWQDYDLWIRLISIFGGATGINNNSYTTDKTHPHERISTNRSSIESAYSIFQKKHRPYRSFYYQRWLALNYLKNINVKSNPLIWIKAASTMRVDLLIMLLMRRYSPKLRHTIRKFIISHH